ncbi:MAG: pyridoxamine 5'-phosphate oxidase family protein [Spirochaetales bacterium]|nr:pyridoxamine 5'-phosphate oxidase family protein [Spirochaetales bacterium]
MFREMRRINQQISGSECRRILSEEKRAVLAVNGDGGYPYALPVNFYYDADENAVFIHSAKQGHKHDSILKSNQVCFTVHDEGYRKNDWSYFVTSVIVFGRALVVEDPETKREKLRLLGQKYFPASVDIEDELNQGWERVDLIRIGIEHMTGKLVHEK